MALRVAEVELGPNDNPMSGPLRFWLFIGIVSAVFVFIGWIIRRRWLSVASIVGTCAIVSMGGLLTLVLSLLIAFTSLPTRSEGVQWNPSIVVDLTAFAKARSHAYGMVAVNHTGTGDYVVRRSWRLDEYGVRPDEATQRQRRRARYMWMLPWEEYGIPFRCFRSRYHFGWPRPNSKTLNELLPRILLHLAIEPIPFMLNTVVYGVFVLLVVIGPRWFRWLARACYGQCIKCGHQLLLDQSICPECGHLIAPIDRLFTRSIHRSKKH